MPKAGLARGSEPKDIKLNEIFVNVLRTPFNPFADDVRQSAKALAQYLHDSGIGTVVFIDRGARPAAAALGEVWRSMYPEEKTPGRYFINPVPARMHFRMTREGFGKAHPYLAGKRGETVLLFDMCMHTGNGTLAAVAKKLKSVGFTDLKLGLVHNGVLPRFNLHRPPKVDFYASASKPRAGCYPFGFQWIAEKGSGIISDRNRSDAATAAYASLRDCIADCIRSEERENQFFAKLIDGMKEADPSGMHDGLGLALLHSKTLTGAAQAQLSETNTLHREQVNAMLIAIARENARASSRRFRAIGLGMISALEAAYAGYYLESGHALMALIPASIGTTSAVTGLRNLQLLRRDRRNANPEGDATS